MAYKNIKSIIIHTACALFAEKGYDGVSVSEICSSCSITKPTFYYHFKAKEDILFFQYNSLLNDALTSISRLSSDDTGRKLVFASFDIIFDAFIGMGYDLIQNLIIGSLKNMEHILDFPEELSSRITGYIKKGQKDGSLSSAAKADVLFNTCFHAFIGYVIFWCRQKGFINDFYSLSDTLSPLLD